VQNVYTFVFGFDYLRNKKSTHSLRVLQVPAYKDNIIILILFK